MEPLGKKNGKALTMFETYNQLVSENQVNLKEEKI